MPKEDKNWRIYPAIAIISSLVFIGFMIYYFTYEAPAWMAIAVVVLIVLAIVSYFLSRG